MRPITVSLVLHHHQPVGEAHEVIARAVRDCYRPLLDRLWRAPQVKVALRYTGHLLEWLQAHEPAYLQRVAAMVKRGQVELLGGPHQHMALQLLPERDAVSQLQHHSQLLRRLCGATVRGAWLPDGVWDGTVPRVLARVGLQYTFLPQALLGVGGRPPRELDGWFVAEREGAAVGVFPVDARLDALVPDALPRFVAAELQARARSGRKMVTIAVDVERFGLAPDSAVWCWREPRGWVDAFLGMLVSQAPWLKLTLPGQALDRFRSLGRVYPLSAAPPAVGVGALPAGAARRFSALQRAVAHGRDPVLADAAPWLVGGPFEQTLSRHEEANRMHKRMLRVSLALHQRRRALRVSGRPGDDATVAALTQAARSLLSGQDHTSMHGGLGGGIGRPELRAAVWRHLLDAERALATPSDSLTHDVLDYDCDGVAEIVLQAPNLAGVIRPVAGGAFAELHLPGLGNLVNTLRREERDWTAVLRGHADLPGLVANEDDSFEPVIIEEELETGDVGLMDAEPSDDPLTLPSSLSRVAVPTELPEHTPLPLRLDGDVRALLFEDPCPRYLFQEHFLGPQTTLDNLASGQFDELGDFVGQPYELISSQLDEGDLVVTLGRDGTLDVGEHPRLVRVVKRYRIHARSARIDVDYELINRYHEPVRARFAVELNFNLDGRVGPERRVVLGGGPPVELDTLHEARDVLDLRWEADDLETAVAVRCGRPARVVVYPVRSVTPTRDGFVQTHEGTCVLVSWEVELWGQEKLPLSLGLEIERG